MECVRVDMEWVHVMYTTCRHVPSVASITPTEGIQILYVRPRLVHFLLPLCHGCNSSRPWLVTVFLFASRLRWHADRESVDGNKCSDILFFPKLFASGLTPMIPSFELVQASPSRARPRVPQSSSTHVTSVVHYCIATPTAPVLRRMCYEFLRYHEPSIYRPLSPPSFPNLWKVVVMDNDWTYAVGVYDVNSSPSSSGNA
jgi:hypothetical protein